MPGTKRYWTLRYIIINATYFAVYSGIHAYASVFLLEKGFSNTLIGITLALANILSVIFQPLIAGLIDKQGKLTNRNVSMASTALLLIGSVLLLIIRNGIAVIFIIFALIYMIQMVYQPIITAMYFEYEAAGCHIYYGLARGLGSAGFAVTSVFTGMAIGRFGVSILMILDIIFLAIALIVLYFFKKPEVKAAEVHGTEVAHNNLFSFIKTYPGFMLFVLGAVCFFFAHNAINDYMIQIITPLGGTEASMGTAVFIAALLELPTMALIDKIMKKISVKNLLLISGTAFLVKTLLMLIAPNMVLVYISQAMQMLAYAVFIPVSAYFVNQTMARLDQVKGQAYINVSITLGGVFSSLVCGRLLDIKGPHFMLTVSLAVTAIGLVIAFVALKVLRDKRSGCGNIAEKGS
ncbi:MFS transporter [Butyrivibrio sp. AE2032]|uniref:MFS transporter n=1 Tax=Butyrivibrio sp. AE2032 TaxID=1458463 RepID=UPI00068B4E49|nr:MFS transporter [Butyrivibrio sp. AE2032]